MRHLLAAFLLLVPATAYGQALTGTARAIDGDTLDLTGTRVGLFGIDAPETLQACERDGAMWACGKDAAAVLAGLVANKSVSCTQRGRDEEGRIVASCYVGRVDLAGEMVNSGYAVAHAEASDLYLPNEERSRALGIGIWGARFQQPASWRAAQAEVERAEKARQEAAAAAEQATEEQESAALSAVPAVYFRNCDEARAAGRAPIRRGEPGYRPQMDGDNDGIACEPYHGRG